MAGNGSITEVAMAQAKMTKNNQSLEKSLLILEIMAEARRPMRLQEISSAAAFPSSTVLRFLNTYTKMGYVYQDCDSLRYALTLKLCRLSSNVSSHYAIRDMAHGHLAALAEEFQESACLAVEEDMQAVYVDFVDGPDRMLRTWIRIGHRAALHASGVGKAMLCHCAPEHLEEVLAKHPLTRFTERTITDRHSLMAELDTIRSKGYAIDDEECETGARCVAVPVFDFTGKAIAAISVSGPINRMTYPKIEMIRPVLERTAHFVSVLAGFHSEKDDNH